MNFPIERESMGEVEVLADKLWGAQTKQYLEHLRIGKILITLEMTDA